MNKTEAKKRIEKLKKVINYHRSLYHVKDKQEMSDSAFDALKHELYEIEQQFPELITPDSPTQRVGGKALNKFEKVEHKIPMLSIEDVFEKEEVEKWQTYLKRLAPNADFEYFCELKIDGFAISLIYEDGILKRAATRGNGKIGEDVTQNIKTIESIPLRLEGYNGYIEVRGEVYMEKKAFDELNKKSKKQYSNPRNLAAGSIRQLDPKLAASRDLKFLAYDIASDRVSDRKMSTHSDKHKILEKLGFRTEKGKICKDIEEIIGFWQKAEKNRGKLPFQVDGVVITVNNNELLSKLGVAGKSPRGVRAFKFASKQAVTVIKDIKIQVGRTGAITPVAVLKPVNIQGACITRATLHNEDEIKRLGVKIGDTVIIERAGDVIPAVDRVLTDLRTGKEKSFVFPKNCPVCGVKLVKAEDEVIWRCPNLRCDARKSGNLEHFVSKKGFNIEGLGPRIIKQLSEQGLVSNPVDLFELKQGDLVVLERFAEKSAENLIKEIEKSKTIPLDRFLYSLGIRHVGEETAFELAKRFSLNELVKADNLESIPDVGEKVGQSIYNWFGRESNLKLLSGLKKNGIKILPVKVEERLKGKSFVITGSLSLSRERAHEMIRENGGDVSNSVSKNTDYLVMGDNPGTKLDKAKELGVKVINEKEFNVLLS